MPYPQGLAAVLLGLSLAFMSPTHAADERLVERVYSADEVVRIEGRLGVQATVGFGQDEHIENVAVGDSQKWQITPNKRANLLFVKPLEGTARTNMTVVTDRHTYFFDLVASPRARPVYMLRFTYKDEDKKQAAPAPALALNDAEQQILEGDLAAAPADPARLNFAWQTRGDARIMPSRIYDDGDATYLVWPGKQAVPAILVRNEKGEEGPVNYAVRGDTIVIDDVPSLIVLRTGKAQATLTNMRGDAPAGSAARSSDSPAVPATPVTPAAQATLSRK